jgi:hypothetical protein
MRDPAPVTVAIASRARADTGTRRAGRPKASRITCTSRFVETASEWPARNTRQRLCALAAATNRDARVLDMDERSTVLERGEGQGPGGVGDAHQRMQVTARALADHERRAHHRDREPLRAPTSRSARSAPHFERA